MPRQYGLTELQRLVDLAHADGFTLGRAKAVREESDVPRAEDLLETLGIEHPLNIEYDPTKPRSWHGEKPSG